MRLVAVIPLFGLAVGIALAADLSGTVQDFTKRVRPGVIALLSSQSAPVQRYISHTDSAGVFRFRELPPGTYALDLEAPGMMSDRVPAIEIASAPIVLPPITLYSEQNLPCRNEVFPADLRLLPVGRNRGALSGRFLLFAKPSNDTSVYVQLRDAEGVMVRAKNTTVAQGFRFIDLPPGKYTIRIVGQGIYEEKWEVTARNDLDVEYVFPMMPCKNGNCDPALRHKGEAITICE